MVMVMMINSTFFWSRLTTVLSSWLKCVDPINGDNDDDDDDGGDDDDDNDDGGNDDDDDD